MVPEVGLEPTPPKREVFETSASANSAIRATVTQMMIAEVWSSEKRAHELAQDMRRETKCRIS